jgi:hypothetical protein
MMFWFAVAVLCFAVSIADKAQTVKKNMREDVKDNTDTADMIDGIDQAVTAAKNLAKPRR